MATGQQLDRRRTTRVPHKVRIILSGLDSDGFNFAEETETVTVGKQGAAARTRYNLTLGQEVSVRTKNTNRVAQLQVVWVGKPGTPQEGLVGLEWLEAQHFWGVDFPPEDWGSD